MSECPAPEITDLENGQFRINSNVRAGYFLVTDVIEYTCDDNFVFHIGNSTDYTFECSRDGSWFNSDSGNELRTVTPLCITGLKIFTEKKIYLMFFESIKNSLIVFNFKSVLTHPWDQM